MATDMPHQHREALAAIGGWAIVRALAEPDVWVSHLRASRYGSTHLGAGSWHERTGFDCTERGIEVGRRHPTPRALFVITWAALTAYARSITPADRALLMAATARSEAFGQREFPTAPAGLGSLEYCDWQSEHYFPYKAERHAVSKAHADALAVVLRLDEGDQLALFA